MLKSLSRKPGSIRLLPTLSLRFRKKTPKDFSTIPRNSSSANSAEWVSRVEAESFEHKMGPVQQRGGKQHKMLTNGLHGGKRTEWHFHSNFGTSEQSPHDEESYPIHWSRTWYADCVPRITPEGVGQIKIRDQGDLFVRIQTEYRKSIENVEDGLQGADGWQPKSLATASGRRNQPAGGLPESNHVCPGPSDIMREKADQNQHSQSQPG